VNEGKPASDPQKYRYIDALRGYAILGVLAVHCYNFVSNRVSGVFTTALFQNAGRGVQLFYIVSTVTLFLSQSRRSERERYPMLNFFIRRFFRIVPMFWLGVAFYGYLILKQPIPVLRVALLTFGFYPDTINAVFPGSWSIAVETSFYALFPVMFATIRNIWSALIWLVATVLLAHFTYGLYQQHFFPAVSGTLEGEDFKFLWIGNQLPVFALGSVVYFVIKDRVAGQRPWLGLFLVLLAVLMVVPCLVTPDGRYYGLRATLPLLGLLHPYMPACAGLAVFVVGMFFLNDRVLANAGVIFLGKISYSFYILNMFIVGYSFTHLKAPQGLGRLFLLSLLVGSVLSTLTYLLVEIPGIACGKRVIAFIQARAPRLGQERPA
jgi:peptidoglycan/LPS O-acetylase OafA/YrhL